MSDNIKAYTHVSGLKTYWFPIHWDANCPICGVDMYHDDGRDAGFEECKKVADAEYMEGFRYEHLRAMCNDCYGRLNDRPD